MAKKSAEKVERMFDPEVVGEFGKKIVSFLKGGQLISVVWRDRRGNQHNQVFFSEHEAVCYIIYLYIQFNVFEVKSVMLQYLTKGVPVAVWEEDLFPEVVEKALLRSKKKQTDYLAISDLVK